ncbi:MAG: T9SS type A sorting domain-containing protein [Bacteroidetes bacterium]|nr:T9SS type A sorting domain-containing protein [Bacteroidota bacterium]
MLNINPADNIFRVSYLSKGGTRDTVKYASSTDVSIGFTRFAGPINYTANASSDVAPDVMGAKVSSSSIGGIVYAAFGNAGTYYHGENFPLIGISNNNGTPEGFNLSQNYPNPFNPTTNIKFNIPVSGFTSLKVYDIIGNEVATLVNQNVQKGEYSVQFNTSELNLSSGVYFYRLTTGNFTDVKKMSLIK